MCYQKVQRLMMASVIALGTVLLHLNIAAGFILLWFVVVMAAIWGLTDFCPSLWFLEKAGVRSCYGPRDARRAA